MRFRSVLPLRTGARPALLLALLLASPAAPAGGTQDVATPELASPEIGVVVEPLASPAGERSHLPHPARGADGRTYLSWIDRPGGALGVLRIAWRTDDGWAAPVEVVRGEDLFLNWADFPSVAALADGTLMAQWLRRGASPHAYDVEFALSVDRGASWSRPRRLHDDRSAVEHGFVSLVALDDSRFAAVWLDGRAMASQASHEEPATDGAGGHGHGPGAMTLRARTIVRTGELGPEVVLDERVCDCCQTSLVRGAEGALLAAYRDRSPGEVRDIAAVALDAAVLSGAQPPSLPVPVFDDGWEIAGCPVNGPRLASRGDRVAAAWFTGAGEGGGRVAVAFRSANGRAFGFPIGVDDGSPVGRVDVLFVGDDSVLVTWLEYVDTATGAEWRARRVWRDGRTSEPLALGAVPHERSSGFLRLAPEAGGAVAAWTSGERTVRTVRLRFAR